MEYQRHLLKDIRLGFLREKKPNIMQFVIVVGRRIKPNLIVFNKREYYINIYTPNFSTKP